jgi:uncharacterized protein (TIGR03118 family)
MSKLTSPKNDQNTHSLHPTLLGLVALLALPCLLAGSKGGPTSSSGPNQQTYLVSDVPNVSLLQDTNLISAWGISFSPNSPFWISANGTGLAEVYSVTNDSLGAPHVADVGLEVAIPGNGTITGQACNNTSGFNGDLFLFASDDGTISGWRPALIFEAETLASRASADYKGITVVSAPAITSTTTQTNPMLLAANFSEGTVDVYDGNMNLVGQYSDPNAPAGYAPFNVQVAAGKIFVTFARQDATKHNVVTGPGYGLIDIFNLSTHTFQRFATGSNAGGKLSTLNAPWGVVYSPSNFGKNANQFLFGNYGSGTIMAFNTSGRAQGLLMGPNRSPVVINGLLGLSFGNGAGAGVPGILYYTASSYGGGNHGLFGQIKP